MHIVKANECRSWSILHISSNVCMMILCANVSSTHTVQLMTLADNNMDIRRVAGKEKDAKWNMCQNKLWAMECNKFKEFGEEFEFQVKLRICSSTPLRIWIQEIWAGQDRNVPHIIIKNRSRAINSLRRSRQRPRNCRLRSRDKLRLSVANRLSGILYLLAF